MTQEITYEQLHEINLDIEQQTKASPAFYFFNKEKIIRFYQKNKLRLDAIGETRKRLIEKYVQKNDAGEYMTQQMENGTLEYVFETPENKENYLKEVSDFMNRSLPAIF